MRVIPKAWSLSAAFLSCAALAVVACPARAAEPPRGGAEPIESETTPGLPASAESKVLAKEFGLFGVVQPTTRSLGVGRGLGLDMGLRWALGGGAFAVHLRPAYERFSGGGDRVAPCDSAPTLCPPGVPSGRYSVEADVFTLGIPLSYRFLAPSDAWSPYVSVGPVAIIHHVTSVPLGVTAATGQLLRAEPRDSESSLRIGVLAVVGVEVRAGSGAFFVEAGWREARAHALATGDAGTAGPLGALGYHLTL